MSLRKKPTITPKVKRRPASGNPVKGHREPVMFMKEKQVSEEMRGSRGPAQKNHPIESKAVNKLVNRLDCGENKTSQNEGITRDVAENKQDTKSTWLEFTPNP